MKTCPKCGRRCPDQTTGCYTCFRKFGDAFQPREQISTETPVSESLPEAPETFAESVQETEVSLTETSAETSVFENPSDDDTVPCDHTLSLENPEKDNDQAVDEIVEHSAETHLTGTSILEEPGNNTTARVDEEYVSDGEEELAEQVTEHLEQVAPNPDEDFLKVFHEVRLKKCPECGMLHDDSWEICLLCSEPLSTDLSLIPESSAPAASDEDKDLVREGRHCPECNRSYDESWGVCLHCRVTLED